MDEKNINREYMQKFFRLTDSEQDSVLLDYIMTNLVLKEYEHNSYICRAGDEANEMYFIESGTIVVWGKDGEISNELHAGSYFGEYAAITGDKRIADTQARGTVFAFVLAKETLMEITKKNAGVYGAFLRKVYEGATENYRKLIMQLNTRRGIGSRASKKIPFPMLCLKYGLVSLVFLVTMIFAPSPSEGMHPFWVCSPILFMITYMVITQRVLETLVISLIYISILLAGFNFVGEFSGQTIDTIQRTAHIILRLMLLSSLTRLFAVSGSINALRHAMHRKIKTASGTLLASFLTTLVIPLDEALSNLINSGCYKSLADEKRIPREKASMVMGISPNALCVISPISLTGLFITGLITLSTGEQDLFLSVIPYNFTALLAIVFLLLLTFGKLPLVGGLKEAHIRVKQGGSLWPEGTDVSATDAEQSGRGRLINLLLPVLVLILSSIIAGTLEAGVLRANLLHGMVITLIFTFVLYCFQQFMTPDQFFKHIFFGAESMTAPVIVFVVGRSFIQAVEEIGFSLWLNEVVYGLIQGQVWLLPPIIFAVCVIVCVLLDSTWAMYAICIPITAGLAIATGGNLALCIGAVCAAGFIGNELTNGNMLSIGPLLGVNPTSYYKAKLPYMITIAALAFCAYTIVSVVTSAR